MTSRLGYTSCHGDAILSSQVVLLPLQSVKVANFCAAMDILINQDAETPVLNGVFFSHKGVTVYTNMDRQPISVTLCCMKLTGSEVDAKIKVAYAVCVFEYIHGLEDVDC